MDRAARLSLQDLRRVADTLAALRGRSVAQAVMRSDGRQLRIEMGDGSLLVVAVDTDPLGRPRLEVDVVRPVVEATAQLEVRFDTA
jgi:hypothetical protein